jgi:preprotein translocase subunit SecA
MAVDDEILQEGFGPERAGRLQRKTAEMGGELGQFQSLLRRAQRKVERKHFRDRNVLLHHERERKKLQKELGQDPYLDTAE